MLVLSYLLNPAVHVQVDDPVGRRGGAHGSARLGSAPRRSARLCAGLPLWGCGAPQRKRRWRRRWCWLGLLLPSAAQPHDPTCRSAAHLSVRPSVRAAPSTVLTLLCHRATAPQHLIKGRARATPRPLPSRRVGARAPTHEHKRTSAGALSVRDTLTRLTRAHKRTPRSRASV